jgi:putative phosphoesterase
LDQLGRTILTPHTTVGLIADTHGLVRPDVWRALADVDLIVHAGDVGRAGVMTALASLAPLFAVSGNVDDRNDPLLPRERAVRVGALMLHVSHGDEVGRPTPERLAAKYDADVIVYGHTHRALVVRTNDGRVVVNPGAAGPRRFNLQPSVARLVVRDRSVDVEIIALR